MIKKNIQDLSAIILHHIMKPGELKSGLIFLVYLIAKYFFKYWFFFSYLFFRHAAQSLCEEGILSILKRIQRLQIDLGNPFRPKLCHSFCYQRVLVHYFCFMISQLLPLKEAILYIFSDSLWHYIPLKVCLNEVKFCVSSQELM